MITENTMNKIVSLIFILLIITACACPFHSKPERDGLEVVISWDGDADLDIELWSDESDSASQLIGTAEEFGSKDEVGSNIGMEQLYISKESYKDTMLVGVHFWSPGPSKKTDVTVEVSIFEKDKLIQKASSNINDDSGDLWLTFRINPELNNIELVNKFRHINL